MQPQIMPLILICGGMFAIIGIIAMFSNYYSLNTIKSRKTGDGQHGTARWATQGEIKRTYAHVPTDPNSGEKAFTQSL